MRKIKFNGFPPTRVALTVSQGDYSVSAETIWSESSGAIIPPESGPTPTPEPEPEPETGNGLGSLSITVNREKGTAPAGFIFEADATGFPTNRPYHDLDYVWDFGEPGSTFSRMADKGMPWTNDANIAYGPNGSHTYHTPGTYTITCTARDRAGNKAIAQVSVEVEKEDLYFIRNGTFVVSAAGNFAGAPSGAVQYTSIHDAFSAAQRGAHTRILLRRGETYDTKTALKQIKTGNYKFQLGTFGDGADPILTPNGLEIEDDMAGEISLWGFTVKGNYNPATAHTVQPSGLGLRINYNKGSMPAREAITVSNVRIEGMNTSINMADLNPDLIVNNCELLGHRDYGFTAGDAKKTAFTGVAVMEPKGTKNGPGKAETPPGTWYPQHFFRMSRANDTTVFDYIKFVTRASWTTARETAGVLKGPDGRLNYDVQPPLRWNTGGGKDPEAPYYGLEHAGTPESRMSWTRAVSVGGTIQMGRTNDTIDPQPARAVFDMFVHVTYGRTGVSVSTDQGGVTFRNGLAIKGDIDLCGGTMASAGAGPTEPKVIDYDNEKYPVEFYNLTLVDLKTGQKVRGPLEEFRSSEDTPFDVERFENNALWAPGYGRKEDGPFDLSTVLFDPEIDGFHFREEPVMREFAIPASQVTTFRPLQGSPVIGNADNSRKVAVRDFWGNIRPEAASRGAMEPS